MTDPEHELKMVMRGMVVNQPHVKGKCCKSSLGDGWCGMQELVDPSLYVMNQLPPPTR